MTRASLVASALAMLTFVFAIESRADEGTESKTDPRARAQQLFDDALTDAEKGNFAAACPKFLASQEADPKTSTLLNLANCYEKNGQSASAWGAFREAEGRARKAGRADWEGSARGRAEALEPKLVRLSIIVPPETGRANGLAITRDGARLSAGEWGVAIPVDPGDHVVTASAEGRVTWETRTSVHERDLSKTPADTGIVEVTVPPLEALSVPPPPVAPPPARNQETSWSTMKTTGAIVAGAGAVGLLTGGVLGLVAKGNYNDARDRCRDGARGCPAGAVADADGAYSLAAGATVTIIVGAVLLAGGAAVFTLAPEGTTAQARAPRRIGTRPGGLAFSW